MVVRRFTINFEKGTSEVGDNRSQTAGHVEGNGSEGAWSVGAAHTFKGSGKERTEDHCFGGNRSSQLKGRWGGSQTGGETENAEDKAEHLMAHPSESRDGDPHCTATYRGQEGAWERGTPPPAKQKNAGRDAEGSRREEKSATWLPESQKNKKQDHVVSGQED